MDNEKEDKMYFYNRSMTNKVQVLSIGGDRVLQAISIQTGIDERIKIFSDNVRIIIF